MHEGRLCPLHTVFQPGNPIARRDVVKAHIRIWMGVVIALNIAAGLLWAEGVDPSKVAPTPDQKVSYPIPVPNIVVTGRVLTDVGMTPIAGARVRLESIGDVPYPGPIVYTGATPPPPTVRSDQPAGATDGKSATTPAPAPTDRKPESAILPSPYPSPEALTDAQGYFKIAAYPGKCVVRIEAQGFEPEYFEDVRDKKAAKQIELQYGMSPVELAIKLKSISTLAGKVTDAGTGKAVTSGIIIAAAERIGIRRQAAIGADGSYLIEGLTEGRYTVQARARGYLPATYTKPGGGRDSSIVTVPQNGAVTGIDFALSKGLSFSGKVTVSGEGPLAGATVVANRSNTKEPLEQTAETGADGSYTMSGLLAGDYIVYARKPGYAAQVYLNAKDRSQAKLVTVSPEKQPADIDFALGKVGSIFGTITARADGKPVEGAVVTAYGVAGAVGREVRTDAKGQYLITELPTADFLVMARANGFVTLFYQNTPDKAQAKPVRVLSDAHTTGIDFAMAPMATISGTVTGPDGPIAGATVALSRWVQIRPLEPGRPVPLPYPQPGVVVRTDAKGNFKFENVEAGVYVAYASAEGLVAEYYDNVQSFDAAKPIEVAVSQNITGINFQLATLGVISGKVAGVDGKPLRRIEVVAFIQRPMRDGIVPPQGGPQPAGQTAGPTTTKEGVVASPGQGGTQPPGGAQPQPPTRDATGSPPPSGQAQPQPPPSKDGPVPPGPVDQEGAVAVASPIPPDGLIARFRAQVDTTNGTYRIVGLPAGDYVVQVSADGYIPEFYEDAASVGKAKPLTVKNGDRITGIDFVLARGGAISGFVLGDGDGRPVRGGQVSAQLLGDGGSFSPVAPNGAFRVDGLRDGKYLLRAEAPGYIAEFYDGTRQPDKAKLIEIKGGNEVSDLIIGLAHRSPVDFNGDGVVDFEDFCVFTIGFGQRKGGPNYDMGMDLNGDGKIDFEDFFGFVSAFSQDKQRAGKPIAGGDAGRVSFTGVSAPSGLVAVRMTLDAPDMAGYAAALGYDRERLTFVSAERQDGGAPTVSSSPDGLLLADRAIGPVVVTLTFRASGNVTGDLISPKMIALLGADGTLRPIDVANVRAEVSPRAFELNQNVPNPFNPATQIAFDIPVDGPVNLTVYNLLGQKVRILVDERRTAGHYTITWDGKDAVGRPAATGMYLCRLTAPGFVQTRKMMLLR